MGLVIKLAGTPGLTQATEYAETVIPQTLLGLPVGSYNVGRIAWAPSTVAVTAAPDTVAPVLSGVSAAKTDTTGTLAWSTDEANGTAYWSRDTTATRTAAQIIAVGNATPVSAVGPQTPIVVTGLTASTAYFFHLVHVDAAGNQSTVVNTSFTTNQAVITAAAQVARFGSNSPSGAIGFKPLSNVNTELDLTSYDSFVSGTALGSYVPSIVAGRLTFTGAVGAPSGAVLRCGYAGGTVDLTISAPANTQTVGNDAELAVIANLSAAEKAGLTVYVRAATYTNTRTLFGGKLEGLSGVLTLQQEKPAIRPRFNAMYILNGTNTGLTQGNITLDGIDLIEEGMAAQSAFTGTMQGSSSFACFAVNSNNPAANITVRNCRLSHNVQPSTTFTRPEFNCSAAILFGNNILFEDNIVEDVSHGISITGNTVVVRRNIIRRWWDDPFKINPISGVQTGIEIYDNIEYDCIGDSGYHPDYAHIFLNGGTGLNGYKFRGNVAFPGSLSIQQPVRPTKRTGGGYAVETAVTTTSRTLVEADGGKIIYLDARTVPFTLSLSNPASVVAADFEACLTAFQTPAAGITLNTNGYTLYDLDNNVNITTIGAIPPWGTFTLWCKKAENRWVLQRRYTTFQGQFTNATTTGIINAEVAFNMMYLPENCVNADTANNSGWTVANNSFIPVWTGLPADQTWFDPKGGNRFINFNTTSTNQVAVGNIAGTVSNADIGDTTTNVLADRLDLNNSLAAVVANFNTPDAFSMHPTTPAQAIAYGRPKTSLLRGYGAGLAINAVDDIYEHYNGSNKATCGFKNLRPWYVLNANSRAIGGGFYVTWAAPAYVGNGAITNYRVSYSKNGGASVVLYTGLSLSAQYEGGVVGDTFSVTIEAQNANGWGPVQVVPTVTVAYPTPALAPSLSVKSADTFIGTTTQRAGASFTPSGLWPLLIVVESRSSTTTTTLGFNSTTIGAVGRAFGTGVALTPVLNNTAAGRNMHTAVFWTPAPAATAQNIQLDFNAAPNGTRLLCYEVINGRASLIGATVIGYTSSGTSAALSLKSTQMKSTIIGGVVIAGAAAITSSDVLVENTAVNAATQSAVATESAATVATYVQTFSWTGSLQHSEFAVELLSA